MNVLIADGSAYISERLKLIIETENYSTWVYGANSYETSLQFFKENKPAVVLIGMNLPGDGSVKLLKAMKGTGHQSIIIVLYINISDSDVEKLKILGATIFLDKFLEFEKIPAHINEIDANQKPKKNNNLISTAKPAVMSITN